MKRKGEGEQQRAREGKVQGRSHTYLYKLTIALKTTAVDRPIIIVCFSDVARNF